MGNIKLVTRPLTARCDKCGGEVDTWDDAISLEIQLYLDHGEAPFHLLSAPPRHLLARDGCPGSPSRAQYLEGQPRDTRPEYPYNPRVEVAIRSAYEKIQIQEEE